MGAASRRPAPRPEPTAKPAPGSTPKGEHRRQLLLDAVLRVLEHAGAAGVSHRAVAAEAGLPPAAATYYFSGIDDMLASALRQATETQALALASLAQAPLADIARALARYVGEHRAAAIAQYELLFLAMRKDSLRDDAELWYRALGDFVAARLPDADATDERRRQLAWAIDGLLLHMLWRGEPATPNEIESALVAMFSTPPDNGIGRPA
jgi:TetR/AcrR family transcriptional regulator, regulator of biofilm formation and stress response